MMLCAVIWSQKSRGQCTWILHKRALNLTPVLPAQDFFFFEKGIILAPLILKKKENKPSRWELQSYFPATMSAENSLILWHTNKIAPVWLTRPTSATANEPQNIEKHCNLLCKETVMMRESRLNMIVAWCVSVKEPMQADYLAVLRLLVKVNNDVRLPD